MSLGSAGDSRLRTRLLRLLHGLFWCRLDLGLLALSSDRPHK